MPSKYDKVLGALELTLVNQMHFRSMHLHAFMPQRPGFRHHWSFDHSIRGMTTRKRADSLPSEKEFYRDPLDWCLCQMLGAPDVAFRFDHAMLFAFLDEHLSKSSPAERARLDQRLYDKLSDYAANHELLVAVRFHRPLNTNRTVEDAKKTEPRKGWRCMGEVLKLADYQQVAMGMGKLLKAFDKLPIPSGHKDQTWLDRSDNVRTALSLFWAGARKYHQVRTQNSKCITAEDVVSDLEVLQADTCPEHLAAVEAERQEILAKISSKASAPIKTVPTYEPVQTQWGLVSELEALSLEPRSKPKTRRERPTLPINNDNLITQAKEEKRTPAPKLLINKQTFNIFARMYPATIEETAKTTEWKSFVLAMAEVGFSAINSGGSAVIFEKEHDGPGGRSGKIVFHRPHPVAKMDPIMFHSVGRRMIKWFGWNREIFSLRS